MKKRMPIQKKIFIVFSSVIICIICLFIIVYSFTTMKSLRSNAQDSLSGIASQSVTEINNILNSANNFSNYILFSKDIKSTFYTDMYIDTQNILKNRRAFNDAIYNIIGVQSPVYPVCFYKMSGEYISISYYSLFLTLDTDILEDISYLPECRRRNGAKLIVPTHENPFPYGTEPVISLIRTFAKAWGKPKDSFLEVQIPYSGLENALQNILQGYGGKHASIYVFDEDGLVVYPYASTVNEEIYNQVSLNEPGDFFQVKENRTTYYGLYTDTDNGWSVVTLQDQQEMFEPVNQFQAYIIITGLVFILAALFLSHYLAQDLTVPIKRMHDSVSGLTLSALPDMQDFQFSAGVDELEDLNQAFKLMCLRLEQSLEETVAAKSTEIQSRMLALQAQMNPHFLYNTLTSIHILAEYQDTDKVCLVCDLLSDMLRYISSGNGQTVYFEEEIKHTSDYIELIKIRVQDDLVFSMCVDSALNRIRIPRLILQPLVENSTKYAFNVIPPWHIDVSCYMEQDKWIALVTDNGTGFSPEKLDELNRTLQEFKASNHVLTLDGMGLPNIYMRLYLLYGENAVFEFGNNADSGAYLKIGGPVTQEEGEENE